MPRNSRKQLSAYEKGKIDAWRESGEMITAIANRLHRTYNCISNYLKRKIVARKAGSGRPRKTTTHQDRTILINAKRNRRKSAQEIADELKAVDGGADVSRRTVTRRLNEAGLHRCVVCNKPLISAVNRKARLAWAREHVKWSDDQWRRVLWSDESPFVITWKGRKFVWRTPKERYHVECLAPTVKHPAKIMVWGCFAANGTGYLYRINGIMDSAVYKGIMQDVMIPSAEYLFDDGDYIFQQDNDPKHTSNLLKDWFPEAGIKVLPWPSQSPELNPIEHLWNLLDLETKLRKAKTKDQLIETLQKAWNDFDCSKLEKLVLSMRRRCKAVIAAKGYPTKY